MVRQVTGKKPPAAFERSHVDMGQLTNGGIVGPIETVVVRYGIAVVRKRKLRESNPNLESVVYPVAPVERPHCTLLVSAEAARIAGASTGYPAADLEHLSTTGNRSGEQRQGQ